MPRSAKALLAASAGGLLLLACPHRPEIPGAPTALQFHVPPGCERNLTGRYQHVRDPAFLYDGQDDGGTLVLALHRTDAPPSDAGWASTQIVVTRSPTGFHGATRTTAFNALHQPCPVALPTSVVACDDGGLLLRSAERIAIDPGCQPSAAPPPMVEQRLARLQTGGSGPGIGPGLRADAGVAKEAGAAKEAGLAKDAGMAKDAGVAAEAGAAKDAGADAGSDAGAALDGGS